MPLTLKDIARIVGVAESTVSRAINNKPGVGEETRERIMQVVKEYEYKPNQFAQGLAKKETHIIALLLSDLTTPGYTEIIKNIEEVIDRSGYQVILCNTNNDPEKEKIYLELISRNRVDGAIILGWELVDENVLNLALNNKDRLVLVNCLSEEVLIPTILVDNNQGAYLATLHLLKKGYQRIAIIMGSLLDFTESEKLAGYQKALEDYQIPIDDELIIKTDGSRKSGYDSFLQLMEIKERPQAFFVTGDLLAVGLTEAIKTGGYFIPDDFAVICYGETIITSIISPPLSVVVEPLAQLGKLAAEYLIKLIKQKPPKNMIRVLKPFLKERDSSNPQIK